MPARQVTNDASWKIINMKTKIEQAEANELFTIRRLSIHKIVYHIYRRHQSQYYWILPLFVLNRHLRKMVLHRNTIFKIQHPGYNLSHRKR